MAAGEALTSLRTSPLRTLLSTFGVLVGMTTLAAILTYGSGFERLLVHDEAQGQDPTLVVVTPVSTEMVDGFAVPATRLVRFGEADMESALTAIGALGAAALRAQRIERITADQVPDVAATQIRLVAGDYFTVAQVRLLAGQLDNPGAVINRSFALRFGSDPAAALGRGLQWRDSSYRITGVIENARPGEPSTTVLRASWAELAEPDGPLPSLLIRLADTTERPLALSQLRRWVDETYWARAATVATVGPSYARSLGQFRMAKAGVAALAGIAVVAGAIGIMNVMLSAVLERTREIGIRRACGARRRDIRRQFLLEAVTISLAGTVLGLALGIGLATLVIGILRRTIEGAPAFTASLSPGVLAGLLAVAVVTGGLAGWYPATRAARLAPAEAMRFE